MFPFFSSAQYISVVEDPEKADIKVFVSNVESRSDLLVYRTDLPKGYSWEHNEDQPILNNGNCYGKPRVETMYFETYIDLKWFWLLI